MNATPSLTPARSVDRLESFPVTFFAIGMGLMGTTIALRSAETVYGLSNAMSRAALTVSVVLFGLVVARYALKFAIHPRAVVEEWKHPVRIAFFPAASISLLLLSVALLTQAPTLAHGLWIVGAALHGTLALAVIGSWIGHRPFQYGQMTPAWFIPAVGNVIVPIAGARLGYGEMSWLFFSAGLTFWLVLLTLVMNRLVFHDALPGKMVPTLAILVAPPSVAFVAWHSLTGEVDAFGRILLSLGYVFALLVLTQAGKFRKIPFAMSWWALSFPIAALSVASFLYADVAGSVPHRLIGTGLLALLLVVVTALLVRTGLAISRNEISIRE